MAYYEPYGERFPYLFPHLQKGRFHEERIRDFRKSWTSAYKKTAERA